MNIVIHSDDIILMERWAKALNDKCVLIDELDELLNIENSILLINYAACDNRCEKILPKLSVTNKILVLHRIPNLDTAKKMLQLGASGYGNAFMKEHFIVSAVNTIKENMIWLYPEFISSIIQNISSEKDTIDKSKLDILTPKEKGVALLLNDGFTYKEIALKLQITPRTVKAHAHKIYFKLSVKDRIGLALLLR